MAEKLALLYDAYQRRLRQANALDFDDLLLKTVELFDKAADVREEYNYKFRYLMVDEYQDTNRIQYQLIRQLTLAHQNLCVVGDEDQSIYRWRGADIENILRFEQDYPNTRLIRLEQNYRSTQLILDSATAVVICNQARKGKVLWSDRGRGERVSLFEARNTEEEAIFVASRISQARASGRVQKIAVLYRTNAQSRAFEEILRRSGIDYRVVGGLSFYARAEIKDVLAYARLASNTMDSAAFIRIVNTPPRGIGDTTLSALEELARRHNLSFWDALEQALADPPSSLPTRAVKALEGFAELIRELVRDRNQVPVREFLNRLLQRSQYLEMLRSMDPVEAQDRIENLQELLNAAAEADERGEALADFLDHAALVSDSDDYDERARVSLMTVHSAKGLEFSTVFLVGLEEGLFPHKLSLGEEAGIEEERRLCYVGMTRAKDLLILTRARQRRSFGAESLDATRPSRFLSEIPEQLLEPISAAALSTKPRVQWESAVNSVAGAEHFLRQRGVAPADREHWRPPVSSRGSHWKLGARVRHPAYGVGTILECEGDGEDAKLTISFPGYGQKKFIERKAPLEKA
jgi:DNA helicase-2/ATP-dependent DNA helicase PcrA